jgi:hypothetical protein
MLLLIQSGFMMAQTKTVVTQYGEKVTINPYVNNGLTANNGYIQLGGALTQPSVLTTTSAFTLAIQGLQTGGASDNVLVTDASGVLKYVSRASFSGADNLGNHIATQNLNMNSNNIIAANNITANGKTSTSKASIALGSDGQAPNPGDFAIAADANGNVIWHTPSQAAPVSTAFFKYTVATDLSMSSSMDRVKFGNEVVDKSNAVSRKLIDNTGAYSVLVIPKTGYYSITTSVYQFFTSTATVTPRIFKGIVQLVDDSNNNTIATNEFYQYTTSPYYWTPQTVTTVSRFTEGQRIVVWYYNNFQSVSGITSGTSIAGDTTAHPAISYITGYFISE